MNRTDFVSEHLVEHGAGYAVLIPHGRSGSKSDDKLSLRDGERFLPRSDLLCHTDRLGQSDRNRLSLKLHLREQGVRDTLVHRFG